jgi:hypothetical protein
MPDRTAGHNRQKTNERTNERTNKQTNQKPPLQYKYIMIDLWV